MFQKYKYLLVFETDIYTNVLKTKNQIDFDRKYLFTYNK